MYCRELYILNRCWLLLYPVQLPIRPGSSILNMQMYSDLVSVCFPGEECSLSKVEAEYGKLLREREMRKNLRAMEEAGSRVHYFQGDVRDEETFSRCIDGIYHEFGRLDAVIHGAGIIEDKLLEDKTVESFDRVFDTKAISAFILSKKLRPDSLKSLVLFSSIAGRFGSRGQCDYSAVNEVVNKLAL